MQNISIHLEPEAQLGNKQQINMFCFSHIDEVTYKFDFNDFVFNVSSLKS